MTNAYQAKPLQLFLLISHSDWQKPSQQKLYDMLRKIRIELSIHRVNLRVEFPCKVSFSLRIARQEVQSFEEVVLNDGQALFTGKIDFQAQAVYHPSTTTYSEKKGVITIFILSNAIGRNTAGVCNFEWVNALGQATPLKLKRSFERCPDKEASVEFAIRAQVIGQQNQQESSTYQPTSKSRGHRDERTSRLGNQQSVLRVHRKSKTIWKQQQLTPRDSPTSHRQKLNKTLCTPISSRVQQTVRISDYDGHLVRSLRFQLLDKQRTIRKLQMENQNHKSQLVQIRGQLEVARMSTRARDNDDKRENQKLKVRCESLEQAIQQLKQFRLRHQKDSYGQSEGRLFLHQEQLMRIQYLQEQVKHYRKSKEQLEQSLKDHLRGCKHQSDELDGLRDQLSSLQKKFETKEIFVREDQQKYNDRLTQMERQKFKLEVECEQLRAQIEETDRRRGSTSKHKHKLVIGEKDRLLKKNEGLKKELQMLANFKEQYQAQVRQFVLIIEDLKAQRAHLNSQLDRSRQECSRLETLLAEQGLAMTRVQETAEQKQRQLSLANSRVSKLESDVSELRETTDRYTNQLDLLRSCQSQQAERLNGSLRRVKELQTQVSDLEQHNRTLNNKQLAHSAEESRGIYVQQLLFQNRLLKNNIQHMRQQHDEENRLHQQQSQRAAKEVVSLKQRCRHLNESSIKACRLHQVSAAQKCAIQNEKYQALEKQKSYKTKMDRLEKTLEVQRLLMVQKQNALIQSQAQISKLQNQSRLKQQTLQQTTQNQTDASNKLSLCQKQLIVLQQQLADKLGQIRAFQAKLAASTRDLERQQNRVVELQSARLQDDTQMSRIKQQRILSHKEILQQKSVIESLRQVIGELRDKLKEQDSHIQSLSHKQQVLLKQNSQLASENSVLGTSLQQKGRELLLLQRESAECFKGFCLDLSGDMPNHDGTLIHRIWGVESYKMQLKTLEGLRQIDSNRTSKILEFESVISKLNKTVQGLRTENTKLGGEIGELRLTFAISSNNSAKFDQKSAADRDMMTHLRLQMTQLETREIKFHEQQAKFSRAKQALDAQLTTKVAQIDVQNKLIKQLSGQVQFLKQSHSRALNKLLDESVSEVGTREQVDRLQCALRSKEEQNKLLDQTVSSLRTDRDSEVRERCSTMSQVHECRLRIQTLQYKESQLEVKLQRADQENTKLRVSGQHLQSLLSELKQELDLSYQKRFQLIKQNQLKVRELEGANHGLMRLDLQVRSMCGEASVMQAEIRKLREQRRELDSSCFVKRKESYRAEKQLRAKEDQIVKLVGELQSKQQQLGNRTTSPDTLVKALGGQKDQNGQQSLQKQGSNQQLYKLMRKIAQLKSQAELGSLKHQQSKIDLDKVCSQLGSNKWMLQKSLGQVSQREQQIIKISSLNFQQQQRQLQEKQQIIQSLESRLFQIDQNSKHNDKTYLRVTEHVQTQSTETTAKGTDIEQKSQQDQLVLSRAAVRELQGRVKSLITERDWLKTTHENQMSQNRAYQKETIGRFQKHINDILDQKKKINQEYGTHLSNTQSSKKALQGKCALLQKDLHEANRQLEQYKKASPEPTSGTFFMKSISQFQKVGKESIDKVLDIQRGMALTQSQKTRIVNKLRQFALILLRSKTKSLERGGQMSDVRLIVDQYKFLQRKINDLVEYSFAVFQVNVPEQFSHQINQAFEEYAQIAARDKVAGLDPFVRDPIDKLNRFHRSLSLDDE